MKEVVILDRSEYEQITHEVKRQGNLLDELQKQISNRLIDRTFVMNYTGWSRPTLQRYDKKYRIFQGEKRIPFHQFDAIYQQIFGTRASRTRSAQLHQ